MAQALSTPSVAVRAEPARPPRRPPITTMLAVENMHCGGCMRKVEQALAAVPGRRQRRAPTCRRGASRPCTAPAASTTADLVEALARAGFKAAELAEERAEPAEAGRPAIC